VITHADLKRVTILRLLVENCETCFEYFRAMHTTNSHLRYFDYCGNVLDASGKTCGQQGDPLKMIIFCLTAHHLWGSTLNKHQQDACVVAYADDGCIKSRQ
jgi:hypothetical protein